MRDGPVRSPFWRSAGGGQPGDFKKDRVARTFEAIKKRVGGFKDDELRQLLVRSGAVRFYRKRDNVEMWGLRTRNVQAADSDDDGQPTTSG